MRRDPHDDLGAKPESLQAYQGFGETACFAFILNFRFRKIRNQLWVNFEKGFDTMGRQDSSPTVFRGEDVLRIAYVDTEATRGNLMAMSQGPGWARWRLSFFDVSKVNLLWKLARRPISLFPECIH